jgi:branched-chain amino acid aminotransferase
MDIDIINESKLPYTNFKDFPFGTCFTDHMFIIEYKNGEWQTGQIKPYGPLQIMPSMQALHYGQAFFEGMKAYKNPKGEVLLFRPEENAKRFNKTAKRLCMPELPIEKFMEGLNTLLDIDRDWVPNESTSSLYIRPVMFASGEGVKASHSDEYTTIIMACPVSAYYQKPVKLLAELTYSRAAMGGTGDVKAGGNYAGSFFPAALAREKGYDQLMWTDAVEHKYVEEAGTMNIFFNIDGKVVTPALSGTILEGITRASIIILAKELGYEVEERKISLDELQEAYDQGKLIEAFGAGTAATVSSICEINIDGSILSISENTNMSENIKASLEGIKRGDKEDFANWIKKVEEKHSLS